MKKKYIIIFLIHFAFLKANSQDSLSINEKFSNIVKSIYKHSTLINTNPGIHDEEIANHIYDIVYNTPDSLINIDRKLDLLILMIFFERYSSDIYGTKIRNSFIAKDPKVNKDILYLLPFAVCYSCDYSAVNRVNSIDTLVIKEEIQGLNEPYRKYYTSLFKNIRSLAKNNKNGKTPDTYMLVLNESMIKNKTFKERYPDFILMLEKAKEK